MADGLSIPGRAADYAGKNKYSRYYSGTDIRIYAGDYWVDEIVEIGFDMQEQVTPIYGYASHTFDRVARGNRIVQGQFSINFKEAGYLQTILNSLSFKQSGDNGSWFDSNAFNTSAGKDKDGKELGASKDLSVEKVIANFDTLVEDYEKAIWGEDNNATKAMSSRRKDSFFYGDNANEHNKSLKDHGFNIFITYGNTPDSSRRSDNFTTAQSIVGVQLTGVSTRIDPSGTPVQEVYSFLAKDISTNVTLPY